MVWLRTYDFLLVIHSNDGLSCTISEIFSNIGSEVWFFVAHQYLMPIQAVTIGII